MDSVMTRKNEESPTQWSQALTLMIVLSTASASPWYRLISTMGVLSSIGASSLSSSSITSGETRAEERARGKRKSAYWRETRSRILHEKRSRKAIHILTSLSVTLVTIVEASTIYAYHSANNVCSIGDVVHLTAVFIIMWNPHFENRMCSCLDHMVLALSMLCPEPCWTCPPMLQRPFPAPKVIYWLCPLLWHALYPNSNPRCVTNLAWPCLYMLAMLDEHFNSWRDTKVVSILTLSHTSWLFCIYFQWQLGSYEHLHGEIHCGVGLPVTLLPVTALETLGKQTKVSHFPSPLLLISGDSKCMYAWCWTRRHCGSLLVIGMNGFVVRYQSICTK